MAELKLVDMAYTKPEMKDEAAEMIGISPPAKARTTKPAAACKSP